MSKSFNFFYPSIEGGGLEKNLFSLVNSLAKNKYKINFFTYEDNTYRKEFRDKFYFHRNINVVTAKFIPGITHRFIKYFFCFIRLLISSFNQRGIIISFQGNILSIIAAKILRRKIIIRCNQAPSKYINNSFKRIFYKFFYSLSDLILVTSKDFKKEMKKYFGLDCEIHKQSLDINNIKIKSKMKINFNFFRKFKGLKIINVGRLSFEKDQITLLKAFTKLLRYKKARLLILGRGNEKKKLVNFIQKENINNFVKIIPYTSNPFKYIFLSDVKVLTSKYEGNPNILLETACLKKLMISSDCKVGPKEILQNGKGGILFKVEKFNELYLMLRRLNLKSKEIKKKIENSYWYVKKNYQKDNSQNFINLIEKI